MKEVYIRLISFLHRQSDNSDNIQHEKTYELEFLFLWGAMFRLFLVISPGN
jgi:hypothetical protein